MIAKTIQEIEIFHDGLSYSLSDNRFFPFFVCPHKVIVGF